MNKKMTQFCEKKYYDSRHYTELSKRYIEGSFTVLLGPNGTGKTLSLTHIRDQLEKDKELVYFLRARKDDVVTYSGFDPRKMACAFHSEGERLTDGVYFFLNETVCSNLMKNKNKTIFVILDEIDSGLSYDKLIEQIEDLKFIIETEKTVRDNEVKFILSCNSYEMASLLKNENATFIWTPTREKIKIGSYEGFIKRYNEYRDYFIKKDEDVRRNK